MIPISVGTFIHLCCTFRCW